jgi:hypothetical protein
MTAADGRGRNWREALPASLVEVFEEACDNLLVGALDGQVPTLEGTVEREGRRWTCQASLYAGQMLSVLSIAPEVVLPDQRAVLQDYVGRLNWGLVVGNAEIGPLDGTIRLRTGLCLLGAELPRPFAEGLVLVNVGLAKVAFRPLGDLLRGTVTAEEASGAVLDHIDAEGIDLWT